MYGCMQSAAWHRGNRVFEGDVGSPQKMAGIWWQEEKSRSGRGREESTEVDLSYPDWQQTTPENRWQVYPESEEAYRQELRREEEAQIERAREAGTTLLSASKNGEGTVRLEPVEAGGTVIRFPIFHYTWKTSGAVGRMY